MEKLIIKESLFQTIDLLTPILESTELVHLKTSSTKSTLLVLTSRKPTTSSGLSN